MHDVEPRELEGDIAACLDAPQHQIVVMQSARHCGDQCSAMQGGQSSNLRGLLSDPVHLCCSRVVEHVELLVQRLVGQAALDQAVQQEWRRLLQLQHAQGRLLEQEQVDATAH